MKKWLKAGYMEKGKYNKTSDGTPQGGIISPLLSNIALNVVEKKWEPLVNDDLKLLFFLSYFVMPII
jgi:RNA-directed DNA polymerase